MVLNKLLVSKGAKEQGNIDSQFKKKKSPHQIAQDFDYFYKQCTFNYRGKYCI